MESTERGEFEERWREALAGEASTPSDSVWGAMDAALMRQETMVIKKRLVFYQWVAAASVTLVMVLGGLVYFNWNTIPSKDIALNKGSQESDKRDVIKSLSPGSMSKSDNSVSKNTLRTNAADESAAATGSDASHIRNSETSNLNDNADNNKQAAFSPFQESRLKQSSGSDYYLSNASRDHNRNNNNNEVREVMQRHAQQHEPYDLSRTLAMEEPQARVKGRLYEVTLYRRLPAMPAVFMNNSRKNEKRKEDLWAAVSASTGTYSQPSVSSQQSFSPMALASVSSTNSSASTHASGGSSYGIGMTVGKKIVNKVVLFGGVNYLNQAINYGSSVTTFGMADRTAATMTNYAMSASAAPVSTTSSYTTSSVSELVSVPVQAGYVIVEKKFGVQLNTGVATDFFLRNTITDQSGTYSRYTQSAGENSPYRTVNWAGLLGTEMSYRMASHYRFSIVPGMRYALNSMVKNESTNSNAFSWNIGFRFRYIFH